MRWRSSTRSTSSSLLVMPSMTFAAASSRRQLDIVDERRTRCIGQGGRCTRARTCSQGGSKNGLSVSLLMRTSPRSKSPGPSIKTSWLLTGLRSHREGKKLLQAVIDVLSAGLPAGLIELRRLGRTLKRRAAVLAFFTGPGTSEWAHRIDQWSARAPSEDRHSGFVT